MDIYNLLTMIEQTKKNSPLNKYSILYDSNSIDLPENSPIYLDLTREEFNSVAGLKWKTFHIMLNTQSVTSTNNSSSVSVYSRDKDLLFTIA